jgi:hypothetical protein
MRRILIAALMMVPVQAAQLPITVYDQAHLSKEIQKAAFDSLRQIFRQAGIDIEVATGDPASREASLMESPSIPRKGNERAAACRARRDIALEIVGVTSPLRKRSLLGMAEPLAREGLNARVFDDRIQDAAMRQNREHAAVLAHTIAHEIGHVLLRTTDHRWSGLDVCRVERSGVRVDGPRRYVLHGRTGEGDAGLPAWGGVCDWDFNGNSPPVTGRHPLSAVGTRNVAR